MAVKITKIIINKYKSFPVPVRASFWFIVASIVQKGISFIATPIFTRIMSPSEYGMFSLYQSWYSIILIFTSLNFAGGVFNNGLTKFSEDKNNFTSSLLLLTSLITVVFFGIYLINNKSINGYLGFSTPYVILMFLQLFFEPAYLLWSAKMRFEYRYQVLIVITILIAIFVPVVGAAAVLFSEDKALARVSSFVIVQVIIYVAIYFHVLFEGNNFLKISYWKYALSFNLPLIPHYLAISVLNQSDRLMIQKFCGADYVAIYSVAYSISMIMSIVTSAINSSFIPYIYKNMKDKDEKKIEKVFNYLTFFVALVVIVPTFIGPEIIRILAPSEYRQAIWIIPPVACSVFFMFLYNLFGTIEFYFEKTKFIMVASCIGAVLNIILNYIFIPVFGFVAAGYTTLVCYIIFAIAHGGFCIYIIKKSNYCKPFEVKTISIISVILLFLMVIITFMYSYNTIRYICFSAICLGMLVNYKRLIALFSYGKR